MLNIFREIFSPSDDLGDIRSKYLSRLFGIFSERLVSVWANDERAPFENLGRPTLGHPDSARGYTLDFTLRERSTGKVFVAEMKCEIEYMRFKYFVLVSSSQLAHHRKPAFKAFLNAAKHPAKQNVRVNGRPTEIHGAILIWGAVEPDRKSNIISEQGLHDVLSIEDIQQDLVRWQHVDYLNMIESYRDWSNRLFDGLLSIDPQE